MKYYSINEQTNEVLVGTLRQFDYLDNVTPSYPIFSIIHDAELPTLTDKQALIIVGERTSYTYNKDEFEITINNVFLTSQNLQIVEDHRDEKYYSTQDGSEIEITELGALPENATNQPKPEGFYQWDGNAWIEDLAAKDEAQKQSNIGFLSYETRRTNDAVVVLDDAIEFEVATDEEILQHKALRKYRLMLSRVTNQETWPLNPTWPECPDFFKQ